LARKLLHFTTVTRPELLPIVRAARALIADPAKWNGRNYAEDAEGHFVPVGSDRAVSFDLKGALVRAARNAPRTSLQEIFEVFAETSPRLYAQLLSPRLLTREQALELLDRAIENLSRQSLSPNEVLRPRSVEIDGPGHKASAHFEHTTRDLFPLGDARDRFRPRRR
jgi:hypothetical protein